MRFKLPQNRRTEIPDAVSEDRPILSCEEKPGGGNLLGVENPGGAETWGRETAIGQQWKIFLEM